MAWMRLVRPTRAVTGVVVIPRLYRTTVPLRVFVSVADRCGGVDVGVGACLPTCCRRDFQPQVSGGKTYRVQ